MENITNDDDCPTCNQCALCAKDIPPARWSKYVTEQTPLHQRICPACADIAATKERAGWCIAPMHKSNYMLMTNRSDLLGINNKGGLVK